MNTKQSTTDTSLSFASREDYVAWRSEMRTDYAVLTADIRSMKASISARYKALAAMQVEKQEQDAISPRVMQVMISDEQSQLSGMRKAANRIMTLRTEGKVLARAAHAANHAQREEAA